MINVNKICWAITAMVFSFSCFAGDIEISGAWTRATAPRQDAASVDMTITSKTGATLIGVTSPVAKTAELHSMTSEGGMMRMREVASIDFPAGKAVNLGENGFHLMLTELKAPLKERQSVPLTLNFKIGKQVTVKIETVAEVRSLTSINAPSQENKHKHMHMDM